MDIFLLIEVDDKQKDRLEKRNVCWCVSDIRERNKKDADEFGVFKTSATNKF